MKINSAMNTVNKDMRDAEKNLAGLAKCCGLCSCPWQKVLTNFTCPYFGVPTEDI